MLILLYNYILFYRESLEIQVLGVARTCQAESG